MNADGPAYACFGNAGRAGGSPDSRATTIAARVARSRSSMKRSFRRYGSWCVGASSEIASSGMSRASCASDTSSASETATRTVLCESAHPSATISRWCSSSTRAACANAVSTATSGVTLGLPSMSVPTHEPKRSTHATATGAPNARSHARSIAS
jgi:hypothetical protein